MVVTSRTMRGAGLTHPGELLRQHVLPALSLSVVQASRELGVTRQTLHRILGGQAAISPAMAMRLERFCGVPGRIWLIHQVDYDLGRLTEAEVDFADRPAHALPPETLNLIRGAGEQR